VLSHDSKDVLLELFLSRALSEQLLTGESKTTPLVPRIFHALYRVVIWVWLALKHLNLTPEDALPIFAHAARTGLQEASRMMSMHENDTYSTVSRGVRHRQQGALVDIFGQRAQRSLQDVPVLDPDDSHEAWVHWSDIFNNMPLKSVAGAKLDHSVSISRRSGCHSSPGARFDLLDSFAQCNSFLEMDRLVVARGNNCHRLSLVSLPSDPEGSLSCAEISCTHRRRVHETLFDVPISCCIVEDIDYGNGRFGDRVGRFIFVLFTKLYAVSPDEQR
jgi:hypothetical protein